MLRGERKKAKKKKTRVFCADFETVVDADTSKQQSTDVWACALIEVGKAEEDCFVCNRLSDFMEHVSGLCANASVKIYFHNLKFDGSFILSWCFRHGYVNAIDHQTKEMIVNEKDMPPKAVSYMITAMNVWYELLVKFENGNSVKFLDSLKLLPFSVKRIGESFSSHKKLEMEYKGERYPGWEITPDERKYIVNDVMVVSEALEFMFRNKHSRLTIGSCCFAEYKRLQFGAKRTEELFRDMFPDLTEIPLDEKIYGSSNADEYIRKAYKGGWCYLKPEYSGKTVPGGCTADVNSLYPSVMSGESGNVYPHGLPEFWRGNYIPEHLLADKKKCGENLYTGYYWFIRFRCRFNLKQGKLPCVQIKNFQGYAPEDWLTTSDVFDKTGKRSRYFYDGETVCDTVQTLTMSGVDYQLFISSYVISDFEILDGVWFHARSGLFDTYINQYRKLKMESKGAMRELAKLFLNNLYGKFATSPDASYKVAELVDGVLKFPATIKGEKPSGYIACGAAVTSYARDFTIKAAQQNYENFIYADTDSIHCKGKPCDVKGCIIDPVKFLCWKMETTWDTGYFVRQKTYAEHVVQNDMTDVNPYWVLKCAGMGTRTKELFLMSIDENFDFSKIDTTKYTAEELLFLGKKRAMSDFFYGLTVPGQLKARQIEKGVLLKDYTYRLARKKTRTVKIYGTEVAYK